MIVVGSLNRVKVEAVREAFPEYTIKSIKAPSGVLEQPIGDYMTREGAISRAQYALKHEEARLGIGLEGGVNFLGNQVYVSNWGALVTKEGDIFTAQGAGIELPEAFKEELLNGKELGSLIDHYANKKDLRSQEGAIGLFTANLVTRKEMYFQLLSLLKGQYARLYNLL